MKIRSGSSASVECERFLTVSGLYRMMSNLCYKQTQDLTAVMVIFHNKNFLHWTLGILLQFFLNRRIDIADSDTKGVKLPVDEELKDSRPAINDFDCGVFLFLEAF